MSRSLLLASALLAVPLAGQAVPDTLKVTIDAGFVNAAGNSEVTTLNIGERIRYKTGQWTLTQRFSIVYARTAGVTSTNQTKAGIRVDRPLANPLGLFALAAYERNTFAGIERRFEEAAGVTARLLNRDRNLVETEVGVSLNQQTPVGGPTDSYAAGRAALMYKRDLTEAAYLQLDGEFLPNLKTTEDYRVNALATLVAPISSRIATKLGYLVQYDHLPEPGFETTDRVFTAGLQITF